MARHKGGRWDVGTKDNAVHLERISEDDERVFDDVLTPEEARDLAGLLTKYADKAEESEGSKKEADESDDSDDESGADDSDEGDDSDEPDDDD
jgi:hypothetical protein